MTASVINMAEGAAPSAPGAGTHILYVDTGGAWHILDSANDNRTLMTTDATATIADGSIVNGDLADMAQSTIKGRAAAAGTGAPVDLTVEQLVTMLESAIGALLPQEADWQNISLAATSPDGPIYAIGTAPVPQYCSLGGTVMLRGGTGFLPDGVYTTLGTLPEGFRPEYNGVYVSMVDAAYRFVVIGADGVISSNQTGGVYLNGICFVPA